MAKAFIFPGQGSQFTGMAKALYESSPAARELMDKADEILGFSLTGTMFEGSAEDLKATRVTQPAVFVHSCALALCSDGIGTPDMVGGHSLGEYSALVAADVLDFEDALRLVSVRAHEMQKCCQEAPGTMAAVIGLSDGEVERICAETSGVAVAANYNCSGQVVISGEANAIASACEAAKSAGAKRALPLSVSGAFHSPLMEPAREGLAAAISATEFRAPKCPVYQNVTARPETDPEVIRRNLLAQLTAPVRWTQSVEAMIADGANEFLELGPGSVLQGLVKRIAAAKGAEVSINGIQ